VIGDAAPAVVREIKKNEFYLSFLPSQFLFPIGLLNIGTMLFLMLLSFILTNRFFMKQKFIEEVSMKLEFLKSGAALLTAAIMAVTAVLAFVGCEQPEGLKLSDDVTLTSVTVAGFTAVLGTPGEYTGGQVPEVPLNGYVGIPTDKLADAVITTEKPEGSSTWFAITNNEIPAPAFSGAPAEEYSIPVIGRGELLNIRVRSESGNKQALYRILFQELTQISTLTGVTIGGAVANLGSPAANLADVTAGSVVFLPALGSDAEVVPAKTADGAVVSYRKGTTGEWATEAPVGFADGDTLYIKVVSESGEFTTYYAIEIRLRNNVATVSGITIGGEAVTTVGAGGTAVNVAAANRGAVSLEGDEANNPSIVVTTTDPNATVTGYAVVAANNNNPAFIAVESNTFSYTGSLPTGNHLFIRVVAEDGITTQYYRIVLTVISNVAELAGFTWGGIATPVATLGTPGATWNASGIVAGTVAVTDAQITAASVAIVATAGFNGTRSWGISDGNTEPTWGTTTPITTGIVANNYLYIKVVSQDESNTRVYKAKIAVNNLSAVATLAGITVGGIATTGGTGANAGLGTPNANPASITAAQAAKALFTDGTAIKTAAVVAAASTEAGNPKIEYKVLPQTKSPEAADFTSGWSETSPTVDFSASGNDQVYIRVTAERGAPVNHYRVWVSRATNVQYVAPAQVPVITGTTGDAANEVIDAIWDQAPALPISRLYEADSPAASRDTNRSSGYGKVLWSDDGIYILAVVTDGTVVTTGGDHQTDCLEVFFNTNLSATGNNPSSLSQYRVGAGGQVSGVSPTAYDGWVTATGYCIKMKIPLPADAANDALYGMDLQIASAQVAGTRLSVQMWNNFVGASYQNVTNNGRVKLVGKP
jgi:hypothetical protein